MVNFLLTVVLLADDLSGPIADTSHHTSLYVDRMMGLEVEIPGDKTERTPGCLREGDDGEVSCSGACMGESPSDQLRGDHSAGPLQRTATVGEGGPAHPDDTIRGGLQPGWRTGSPWLLDRCDEEVGREEQSSLTFDLQ